MLRVAKTEFYKLKRYSVIWIGVATMLTVVLLSRLMAVATDGTVHTLEQFSGTVIWNNFSLIFPATITLIVGYIIERERVEDTLKNILTIPLSYRNLLTGKIIAGGAVAVFLAFIEFIFPAQYHHQGLCQIPKFPLVCASHHLNEPMTAAPVRKLLPDV